MLIPLNYIRGKNYIPNRSQELDILYKLFPVVRVSYPVYANVTVITCVVYHIKRPLHVGIYARIKGI